MKSFIICTTQRSGSTLLCETIRYQDQLGLPEENLIYYNLPIEQLDDFRIKLKNTSLANALQKLIPHTSSSNNISSIKLMMSTLDKILQENEKNTLDSNNVYNIFKENYNNPKFVFLKRRNKIKQAISQAYLLKTNISHTFTKEESLKLKEIKKNIELSISEIIYRFEYILKEELKWKLFFLNNKINPQIIYYEDFLKNKKITLNSLAKFLDIEFNYMELEKDPFIITRDSSQKKLEEKIYDYIVKNYTESTLLEYGIKLPELKL